MIKTAAEVYFRRQPDSVQEANLKIILKVALNHLSGKRNNIAHGIVEPVEDENHVQKGFMSMPPYYATRRHNLPTGNLKWYVDPTGSNSNPGTEAEPLATPHYAFYLSHSASNPSYLYSSVEINKLATVFTDYSKKIVDVLTFLEGRAYP